MRILILTPRLPWPPIDGGRIAMARLAEGLALDPQPILARMGAPEVSAVLDENRALAQALGISGTPTFVMGDQMLRGYLPPEEMRARLEAERAG